MTHPSPSDPAAVAVELERIRRAVEVGFAEQSGALALLVQRNDQVDRRLDTYAAGLDDHDRRLDVVERGDTEWQKGVVTRLAALEAGRWPLRQIGALVGVGSLILALMGALWQMAAGQ